MIEGTVHVVFIIEINKSFHSKSPLSNSITWRERERQRAGGAAQIGMAWAGPGAVWAARADRDVWAGLGCVGGAWGCVGGA